MMEPKQGPSAHAFIVECAITSAANWKKYIDTGDNSLLGDIDVAADAAGTIAVLAGEGWQREIILGPR